MLFKDRPRGGSLFDYMYGSISPELSSMVGFGALSPIKCRSEVSGFSKNLEIVRSTRKVNMGKTSKSMYLCKAQFKSEVQLHN
jgi:hypothetical protein